MLLKYSILIPIFVLFAGVFSHPSGIFILLSSVIDRNCLLSISINAYGIPYDFYFVQTLHSNICFIENIYWITDMTYDQSILNTDLQHNEVRITRSNVETNGYLSSLLPLLENSTYSIIIDLTDFKRPINDGWIDFALQSIIVDSHSLYSCGFYKDTTVAFGCLLTPSRLLRSLWMNTEFRINSERALSRITRAIQCKYQMKLHTDFIIPSKSLPSSVKEASMSCDQLTSITNMKCHSNRVNDQSVCAYFSLYKRNHVPEQLKSLFASSVKPAEIILYQGEMHFNFKSVHDANPSIKHLWTTNWNNPFFLRFMIPFLSNSYYFFNIDDDLILGRNTLQTMKDVMDQKNAIPAAYGRYIRDYRFNPPFFDQKVVRPTEEMQSVDFLVVSYGLKLEYVKVFWRYRGMMVRNGEDIHLSMTNHLECNRDSVVPIKTENSSIENLGDDGVASFNKPGHMENRAILIRTWITMGYQPMKPQSLPLPVISKEMRQFYLSRLRYWIVC